MSGKKHILIKNIYYMLSYVYRILNQSVYEDLAMEEFDEMYDMFAAILSKGIGVQLKQGLYRDYRSCQEDLPVMRGKIHMPDTIRNRLAQKKALSCQFDLLTENNLYNQILKTAALYLLASGKVKAVYKDSLKKELLYFSGIDSLDPAGIKWTRVRFHRNNQTYRMLLGVCRLLFEGMLLTTEQGSYRLASFFDEQRMYRLYEKFILEYYKRHYPGLSPGKKHLSWSLDKGESDMLPVLKTDIHLQKGNAVLIIDAKYYAKTTQENYGIHTIHSANLYQIFTYVKQRHYSFGNAPHQVSGMLLYAKTDEEIQPDAVYQMRGNQISVKTLDLNRPFSEIKAQLNKIAEDHFPEETGMGQ
ncbi:MAG: 5-methylcytosine-specific restriction endonuclease system specificity protein McrC [Eubacterium sp.]|jgi:5-methylcytosine-specific restriction enzyme subunit McrC|nr:5-methylcytosine-specific restriction endonuclease system specificity protein McrC [Eubacterium sp.]